MDPKRGLLQVLPFPPPCDSSRSDGMTKVSFPRPLPKIRLQQPLPERLIEFLKDVHSRIEAGDSATKIQSDDLLQCSHTYGGLTEMNSREYQFTYFPDEEIETTWHFDLNEQEIRLIAEGSKRDLELWSCLDQGCGGMFQRKEDLCPDCDWVKNQDASRFTDEEIEGGEALRLAMLAQSKAELGKKLERQAASDPKFRALYERFTRPNK